MMEPRPLPTLWCQIQDCFMLPLPAVTQLDFMNQTPVEPFRVIRVIRCKLRDYYILMRRCTLRQQGVQDSALEFSCHLRGFFGWLDPNPWID